MPVDLESLFASLYTLRLPIAVVTIVVVLLVALLAVRGRWDRIALRHPAATAAAVVILLVVAVPAGWYLASPLFVSTELIEPAPVAVASPTADASASTATSGPAASGAASPSATSSAPSDASAQPSPALATETRGKFSGTDDFHFGRGTARLIVQSDGSAILRLESFAVRNGPDLFVYLSPSKSRYTKDAIELGRLKADRGSFNYRIPAGTDLSRVMSAVIWCKQFSFQFAVAPLS
jgi:hypothetical protein